MTMNRRCFLSLCEDCRLLARDGYEDLTDPNHPLAAELKLIPVHDLARISDVIRGIEYGTDPGSRCHNCDSSADDHVLGMLQTCLYLSVALAILAGIVIYALTTRP